MSNKKVCQEGTASSVLGEGLNLVGREFHDFPQILEIVSRNMTGFVD